MSTLSLRGVRFCRLVTLVSCLAGAGPRAAFAQQAQDYFDIEFPTWRADFHEIDPKNVSQPPIYDIFRDDKPREPRTSSETDLNGVLHLPDIPLGELMPEPLLELFGNEGVTCEPAVPSGVLTRETSSTSQRPDDAIAFHTKADATTEGGWIEIRVPSQVSKSDRTGIKVAIHDWGKLYRKVGAGVFRGHLDLSLQDPHPYGNPRFWGGVPIRVRQPITIVLSGSRLLAADVADKALAVGLKPEVRVEIQSVEVRDSDQPRELDPGWWLQLNEAAGKRGFVARLPLPLPTAANAPPHYKNCYFELPEQGLRAWDTIEEPKELGYRIANEWKGNQLVLQRVKRFENDSGLSGIQVHRYEIVTYLPTCFKPRDLACQVFWDPAAADTIDAPQQADPVDSATRKHLRPITVAPGLNVSTDLPITGEPFEVWTVIDTKSDLSTIQFEVDVVPLDPAAAAQVGSDVIILSPDEQPADPAEPTLVRIHGKHIFTSLGKYRINGLRVRDNEKPALPADWPALSKAAVEVAVLIEGEIAFPGQEDYAHPLDAFPLKVFTDREPIWWAVWRGEEFTGKYGNRRPPEGLRTKTTRAMSFRRAPDCDPVKLFYADIFGARPDGTVRRYNKTDEGPGIGVLDPWAAGQPPLPSAAENPLEVGGAPRDLKDANDPSREYFDLDVKLDDDKPAKWSGNPSYSARFVFLGLDSQRKPIGRAYGRTFELSVRSQLDEFRDAVSEEHLIWGGLALVLVLFLVIKRMRGRRERERKRKAREARAAGPEETALSAPAPVIEGDYFSGMKPTVEEQQPTTTTRDTPQPTTGPSYFDGPAPGEGGGGTEYFD